MRRKPGIFVVALVAAWALVPVSVRADGSALVDLARLGRDGLGWGGWAGPQFKPTMLAGSFCLYGGGPVVILAGPSLGFGLNVSLPDGDADGLSLYYAAARAEYTLFPERRLHLSLCLDTGGGVASHDGERAGTAVLEPQALCTVNLWRSFRLGLGASYRLAVLLGELPGYSPLELSAPCAVVQMQYGLFPAARPPRTEAAR